MARYDSLLLRIWSREGAEGERWISQVEHVQSGNTVRFKDREALLAYLGMIVRRQDPLQVIEDAQARDRMPSENP